MTFALHCTDHDHYIETMPSILIIEDHLNLATQYNTSFLLPKLANLRYRQWPLHPCLHFSLKYFTVALLLARLKVVCYEFTSSFHW